METGVILAGGLGTRLRPLTHETPKAMIDIDGRNLTEHSILLLKRAGVKTVYLAIGHLADQIKDFFGDEYEGIKIKYVVEEEPLGTGGWMNLVDKKDFKEDFIVVNVDDLSDVDFSKIHASHKKNDALITICLHEIEDVRMFGVADMEEDRIKGFVEKPDEEHAPSNLVSTGYYVFSPEVLSETPDRKNFMLEMELFPKIAKVGKLFGYKHTGVWLTTNDKIQWDYAKQHWELPK